MATTTAGDSGDYEALDGSETVSRLAGHGSVSFTLDVYGQPPDDRALDEGRAGIEAALG